MVESGLGEIDIKGSPGINSCLDVQGKGEQASNITLASGCGELQR